MINYRIFQVKNGQELRYIRYASLETIRSEGNKVDPANYDTVYEGTIETQESPYHVLENLYHKFNMDHPSDYVGRSMSVSDVVQLSDDKFYYCDVVGFEEIKFE